MGECSAIGEHPGNKKYRWAENNEAYVCADAVNAKIAGSALGRGRRVDGPENCRRATPPNAIMYKPKRQLEPAKTATFVSEIRFGRSMSQLAGRPKGVRTITFPSTAKEVLDGAFKDSSLRSVVLNEGLEKLGERNSGRNRYTRDRYEGTFSSTQIEHVIIPSTLQLLGSNAFQGC